VELPDHAPEIVRQKCLESRNYPDFPTSVRPRFDRALQLITVLSSSKRLHTARNYRVNDLPTGIIDARKPSHDGDGVGVEEMPATIQSLFLRINLDFFG
jgi:hypothetical protein